MNRKGLVVGAATVAVLGLVTMGAARVHASGRLGPGGAERARIVRAIMDAKLDIVAEKLELTDGQKVEVQAVRDRLVERFQATRDQRASARERFLSEFKKDDLDRAGLMALAKDGPTGGELREAVIDAIVDVHRILTPEQRERLAVLIQERCAARGVE